MPFYRAIDRDTEEGRRIIERLLILKDALADIPTKTVDETLLIATWNIRDFDKPSYGKRSTEAVYYIAEIISRFDIVAVQEVNRDLSGLQRVLTVLGRYWKYVVTDTTEGGRGNGERMAFLYDSRKVSFGGFAGELVLPPVKGEDGEYLPADQVWRTPLLCGFKAGWSRFVIASVHILWGKGKSTGTAEPADRVAEIRKVAQFLRKRTDDKTAWSRNLLLVGDFNIFSTTGEAFHELLEAGFTIPEEMREFTTNAAGGRPYDQIAFRLQADRLGWNQRAGVVDYYRHVFRLEDEALYAEAMGDAYLRNSKGTSRTASQRTTYYKAWRTHQMSDHLPLWAELKIDFSREYLERMRRPRAL